MKVWSTSRVSLRFFGFLDKAARLLRGFRHRLFQPDMLASLQGGQRELVMRIDGRCDRNGVKRGILESLFKRRNGFYAWIALGDDDFASSGR